MSNNICDKINYVDKILWINLERSVDRRKYMGKLLDIIDIPNERIEGIDGDRDGVDEFSLEYARNLKPPHIGCTLSHIKAINSLKDVPGEYFMICEDDISLDNLQHFSSSSDLKNIIHMAPPKFDILLINHINDKKHSLTNLYTRWRKDLVWGTGCYIITRKAVAEFISMYEYTEERGFIFHKDIIKAKTVWINALLDVADLFMYRWCNTWVYRYNFIATQDSFQSLIYSNMDLHIESSAQNLHLIIANRDSI
jgi:GR25 family glycosyltransferase involved in LPS biosynthesis